MPATEPAARLLVIDNYDSFTYNLVQMFMGFDLAIIVRRGDRISLEDADEIGPDYLLVSPGPRDPAHAGMSKALIRHFEERVPILGVCLGMQCINEVHGGRTLRAPVPVHGKISVIHHDGEGLFAGMPATFAAARYHSLMVKPESHRIVTTAWEPDGVIMGIRVQGQHVYGVQFHPESFLTDSGDILVRNFLKTGALAPRLAEPDFGASAVIA